MEVGRARAFETRGPRLDPGRFRGMIEVPSWFLIMIGIAMLAAAHRRRHGTAFLHDGEMDSR